ncbi:hypothetical protein, partial [Actinospica sp.]|uniref:WXG100-like domain-containing protein n=1 Tax=Actinospica sp. TaxID=1872142 RepID=UPI002B731A40
DDLPGPLVNFLNVIGIEWPYINEDSISQFASLVREFGQAVERTHQDASDAVQKLAQAHQGASTQQMTSGWAELSTAHVNEIVEGAGIVADALDAWAAYIVVQKGLAVVQMVEMAVEFFADQAAAVATFGIAEALLPAIIAAGQAAGKSLIEDLEQYVLGKVMDAALKPFMAKVQTLLSGLDWGNTSSAGSGAGSSFSVDEAEARQQISVIRSHADTMVGHGQTLRNGLAGLSF